MKYSSLINTAIIAGGMFAGYKMLEKTAKKEVAKKVDEAANKFNPASDENLVYKSATKIIQNATNNKVDTLGTAVYGWFHNNDGSLKLPWQETK